MNIPFHKRPIGFAIYFLLLSFFVGQSANVFLLLFYTIAYALFMRVTMTSTFRWRATIALLVLNWIILSGLLVLLGSVLFFWNMSLAYSVKTHLMNLWLKTLSYFSSLPFLALSALGVLLILVSVALTIALVYAILTLGNWIADKISKNILERKNVERL